jgi:eukaryotic-like serine/threonine-protein kinase
MNRYKLLGKIGEGGFGIVYRALDTETNQFVAIKEIKIKRGVMKDPMEEINALLEIKRPDNQLNYVVEYKNAFVFERNTETIYYIVTEFLEGTTLGQWIFNNPNRTYREVWPIMVQLVLGLTQIHNAGYAHRDIKLSNLMIDQQNTIKYIDFGISCIQECKLESCDNYCSKPGIRGTPGYIAPEILKNKTSGDLYASQKADIWSLSVVFYKLLYGTSTTPFMFYNGPPMMYDTTYIDRISTIGPDRRNDFFIKEICIQNPEKRPSLRALTDYMNIVLFSRTF